MDLSSFPLARTPVYSDFNLSLAEENENQESIETYRTVLPVSPNSAFFLKLFLESGMKEDSADSGNEGELWTRSIFRAFMMRQFWIISII